MFRVKSAPKSLIPFKDALTIPPIWKPTIAEDGSSQLTIPMQRTTVQLHSDLPFTEVWTYAGYFPGPTIEVRSGQTVQVNWINQLSGSLPIAAVIASDNTQQMPGRSGGIEQTKISEIPAWTVVHLHGGRTPSDSDGWSENASLFGQTQTSVYSNQQRSSLLWYHDHAMGITRYNVYSGLAGMWTIRDCEEEELELPSGEYEIPLLIQDRNLDTEPDGSLTGKLLHKVEENTMEFFVPFTLVNGTIYPYCAVEARHYRLRLLNGASARTYRLVFLDETGAAIDPSNAIWQIGTDSGLLAQPVAIPAEGLILAPAERADLIIDFSQFRGQTLTVVNTAGAPFGGDPAPLPIGTPDLDIRSIRPDVMQFQVSSDYSDDDFVLPDRLSSFQRMTHTDLPEDHEHRVVALVESEETGMLTLKELDAIDPADAMALKQHDPAVEIVEVIEDPQHPEQITFYQVLASLFRDTVNFRVKLNSTEVWKMLNLTGDTHPFHIHLVQFQIMSRNGYTIDLNNRDPQTGLPKAPVSRAIDANGNKVEKPIDENERGWKDTVRVNPGEMVAIAAKFEGFTGRYMYHCHLLEHEDQEMMRPFVVLPAEILALMPNHSSHSGTHSHAGT